MDNARRLLIAILATALALAALKAPVGAQPPGGGRPSDGAPKPVAVAAVVEQEISTGQAFVGTVIPTRRATVGSAVSGRVIEFPIDVGQRVEADQPLAEIMTDTIRLELAAAEADLAMRTEAFKELQNGSRPEELEQAKAQLLSAEAANEYAQARLKRSESLFQRGGVTEEAVGEVRSLAAAARQTLNQAKASFRLVEVGPRRERIEQAVAQVAMQQAVVDRLKDQIKKHTVITRFAGYVVAEHTEAGAWVTQGGPVADVVALDEVYVEAYVPENAIPYVRTGEEVRVEIPSLPDRLVTGEVAAVTPQADLRARTFPVRVLIRNELGEAGPLIKAGMIARAVLPTGPVQTVLLVPKDALVLGGPRPAVYVVEPGEKGRSVVRQVPVTPGVASGALIEVSGDLRAGQNVVTLGNERLRPGDAVEVPRTAAAE